uniref:G-protein coupled receptors family 1 profile domain-containing protein n=1 Tax=Erpetoichthys calabaricus TaxID=27687 RepID=A0A8C4RFQ8_ERPCA
METEGRVKNYMVLLDNGNICGNLALIISILHFKQLRTPSNILILSMAFADFIVGAFNMPVHLLKTTEVYWYKSRLLCFSYNFTATSIANISVFHLLLLAGDRYYAVCYPLFYFIKVTFKVILISVAIVWSFSAFYTFVQTCFLAFTYCKASTTKNEVNIVSVLLFFDLLITFILPFLIIVCIYAKIFFVAKRHAKAMQSAAAQGESGEQTRMKGFQKTQYKAAKTISIVIGVFVSCCLPIYLYGFLQSLDFFVFSNETWNLLYELSFFNSAFNPMIYGFFYPWFWKAFKIIVTCKIFQPGSSSIHLFSTFVYFSRRKESKTFMLIVAAFVHNYPSSAAFSLLHRTKTSCLKKFSLRLTYLVSFLSKFGHTVILRVEQSENCMPVLYL